VSARREQGCAHLPPDLLGIVHTAFIILPHQSVAIGSNHHRDEP
jgi:hypothetical protein